MVEKNKKLNSLLQTQKKKIKKIENQIYVCIRNHKLENLIFEFDELYRLTF